MESKFHYERVVGGSEEEKRAAFDDLDVASSEKWEELRPFDQPKSEKENEIIGRVDAAVDSMIKEWGGDPRPIAPDQVHVLEAGHIEKATQGRQGGGIHYPLASRIAVERSSSAIEFSSVIAHEMLHFKSPKSVQVRSDKTTELYRSGLGMVNRKDVEAPDLRERQYFDKLEEAIVAECTKRFLKSLVAHPDIEPTAGAEMQQIQQFKEWVIDFRRRHGVPEEQLSIIREEVKYIPNIGEYVSEILAAYEGEKERAAYAAGTYDRLLEEKKVEYFERYPERYRLNMLVESIANAPDSPLKDPDKIFDRFARANFTGNYLALARLIEQALGKGSFRKIGEAFSDIPNIIDEPQ